MNKNLVLKRGFSFVVALLFLFTNMLSVVNASDLGIATMTSNTQNTSYTVDNFKLPSPMDLLANSLASIISTGSQTGFSESGGAIVESSDTQAVTEINVGAQVAPIQTETEINGAVPTGNAIIQEPLAPQSLLVPINLTATAGDTYIGVSWDAVIDAAGYDIEVDGMVLDNGNNTSYHHTGLTAGTFHTYKVRAKNETLIGEWSNPVSASTIINTPGVPQNIQVVPTSTAIAITWDVVENATGYDIELDGNILDAGNVNSYTHEGLTPDSEHQYRLRARTQNGVGEWSGMIHATTLGLLSTPQNVAATAYETIVTLTWSTVSGASEYEVDADGIIQSAGSNTGFTHTNLQIGSTHNYRVRAKNSTQIGEWSDILAATTAELIVNPPQNITTVQKSTEIALAWDSAAYAISYDIEVDGQVIHDVRTNQYSINGLTPNTQHMIRVRTVSMEKNSDWSSLITVHTLFEVPQVTVQSVMDRTVTLSWAPIAGAENYEVEVDGVIVNNGTATTYTHSNLQPATNHTYKVRAKSINTFSDWCTSINVRTLPNTIVGSVISQDTVWDISGSPYIIQRDLTINQGVNLQIMPGVIVKISPLVNITVNGKITALGTASQKITFTSSYDKAYGGTGVSYTSEYWGGLIVKSTGEFDGSNTNIRYLGNYYYEGNYRAILSEGKLNLSDSSIFAVRYTGILAVKSTKLNVQNTTFTSGVTAITISCIDSAEIRINDNIIESFSNIGINIYQFNAGIFELQGNTITKCTSYPLYINLNNLSSSIFSGIQNNSYVLNTYQGSANYNGPVLEGTLKANLTLTESDVPYIMMQITIPQGLRLDLQPGVILRGNLNRIIVNGTLNALGTAEKPIILAALQDAAYGGTGIKSGLDSWEGITVSTTGELIGDYMKISDAGYYVNGVSINVQGKLNLNNSEIYNKSNGKGISLATNYDVVIKNVKITKVTTGILIDSTGAGNFTIENNHLESCGYGIYINQFGIGTLSIQGNTLIKCSNYPLYIKLGGLNSSCFENIQGNIYSDSVGYDGTVYDSPVLAGAPKINLTIAENRYLIADYGISVPQNLTLNLQPGVILRFRNTTNDLIINGTLNAIGTSQKPIVFTSIDDPEYNGGVGNSSIWWYGIRINATGVFNGDNIKVRNGYSIQSGSNPLITVLGSLSLLNSEVRHGYDTGIYFDTAIYPTLKFNTFAQNAYGVYNKRSATMVIDAEYNYWNSPYGPGIRSNTVTAGVDYKPWLGEEFKYQMHYGREGVYAPTGNYSKAYSDLDINILGFNLDVTRTYNSSDDRANQVLGRGWSFGYESSLTEYAAGSVKVVRLPNGGVQSFGLNSDGTYSAMDSRSILAKQSDGTYILTTKEQQKYGFNSKGYLVWIKDRNDNMISIDVDSQGKVIKLTDQANRAITVVYQDGKIKSVADWSGRAITYEYTNGLLTKVTDSMGNTTSYKYDDSGYLIETRDHGTHLVEAVLYDHNSGENQHKVMQTTDTFGNVFTYSYDNINKKTTITDTNGRENVQWYDGSMYVLNSRDAESKLTATEYTVDAKGINYFGETKSETDRNGNKTIYERDAVGNITKITNPDTSIKLITYDNKNNITSQKDESGKYTFYIYDNDKRNLVKVIQPLNGTDVYSEGGDQTKFAVSTYEYYSDAECLQLGYKGKGLLKSFTDANDNTYVYTYDQYGNQITTKDPETNKTVVSEFDSTGQKIADVTAKGYRTEYVYDANGMLEKQVLHGGETSRIAYDMQGRRIKEVDANLYNPLLDDIENHTYSGDHGYRFAYYDNGKVKHVIDPENNQTSYEYDLYGNLIKEIKPNGSQYIYEYDLMNRKTKTYFKENEEAGVILLDEYQYFILADKKTKQVYTKYISDTESNVTYIIYDYANRPIEKQNADGTKTLISYYLNGTVKTTTDERGSVTYFVYDGLNRLTDKWVPLELSGSTPLYTHIQNVYDKAGRLIAEKVGKSKVAYPNADTLFSSKFYTYYKNGWVKSSSDSDGRSIEYIYDDDGNVVSEIRKIDALNNKVTEYEYNHLKKPVQEKLHVRSGDIEGNEFGNNEEIIITTVYSYDKNGNLLTVTSPNEIAVTYTYDKLNRQTSVSQPGIDEYGNAAVLKRSSTYDWNGNVTASQDANGNTTSNVYDARGMLTKVVDANDGVTVYYYDGAGRKIAEVLPKDYNADKQLSEMNRTEFTYDKLGRLKTIVNVYFNSTANQWITVISKAYKYDNNGNLIKELCALGYLAGTGATVDEKINSGYGIEYTYNLANLRVTTLDPVSKDNSLVYTAKSEYDSSGRKTAEIRADGVRTNYYYDEAGNVTKIGVKKDAASSEQIIQINTYDLLNNLTSQLDGNGNLTTYEYNAFGEVRLLVYPGDSTISEKTVIYQYDKMGQLIIREESSGLQEIFQYDNQGSILSHTRQKVDGTEAISIYFKYDKNGNTRFETDGNGAATESVYDKQNRIIETKKLVSGKTQTSTYLYDENSNLVGTIDWRNNTYTNIYDPLNRLIEKMNPGNVSIEKLEYNENGQQIKSYDALGNATSYEYDKNNRLKATTDPENHITSQTYDSVGNIRTKKDGKTNTTTYNYDEFNRLSSVVNAKNETTSYTYDLNGNLLKQTDGKGNTTTYEYNAANLPSKKINHGGRTGSEGSYQYDPAKTETYTYNENGKLKTKVDRNGITTTYIYDIHDRLINQATGEIEIAYTYDSNGNQLTMLDGTGITTRTYDELNRVLTKSVPTIGTVQYEYDITDEIEEGQWAEKTIDPKGNITLKVYDSVGRISKVIAGGESTTYSYYDNGARKTVLYHGGAKEEYSYFKDNQLKSLINRKADGSIINEYSYTYDGAHNQTTKIDEMGTISYDYDTLNRLEKVTEPSGRTITYTFDKAGNRLTETVVEGTNTKVATYTYDVQNRLNQLETKLNNAVIEVTVFAYDNNGNQLSIVQTPYQGGIAQPAVETINTYDKLNRLVSTTNEAGTSTYGYNGDGLRVEKNVNGQITKFLYEYDKVILELDQGNSQIARNIYGTNLLVREVQGQTAYYMYNGHGDVTALIGGNGETLATYYYDAFGNLTQSTGSINNPYRYSGYQYDSETKLYYLNSRMYDPLIARFLQEDTYNGDMRDPLSLNLYTYVHNNPITYDDPNGHWIHIAVGALIGGLAGAITDVASQMIFEKKSLSEIDWKSTAVNTIDGALSGAIGAATGGMSLVATGTKAVVKQTIKQVAKKTAVSMATDALNGGATNAIAQLAVKGKVDWKEVALSGAANMLPTAVGSMFAKSSLGQTLKATGDGLLNQAKQSASNLARSFTDFVGPKYAMPDGSLMNASDAAKLMGFDDNVVNSSMKSIDLNGSSVRNTGASEVDSLNPNKINFSQRSVSENVLNYVEDMKSGNWDWSRSGPLKVMERDGQWVSYDNRRLMAAQQAELDSVPVQVVKPTELVPGKNFTWEKAFNDRFNDFRNIKIGGPVPNSGLSTQPSIVVRKGGKLI